MLIDQLQPGTHLKRSPFLVLKSLGKNNVRVYSRLHGNLTSFAFDIDGLLKLFDTQTGVETVDQVASRFYPVATPGIVEELYRRRFIVDARLGADVLFSEYFEKAINATKIPKISKITFLVSEECNLSCRGCYHTFHSFKNECMTSDLAEKILEGVFPFLQRRGISRLHIAFLGYEPLLNFETLRGIYDFASRMGEDHDISIRFKIYTNAFRISEEICHWIKQRRSNLGIKVSLDGIKADNDKRRVDFAGNGSYDRVVENLKRFVDEDIECSVLTVLSKLNLSNIEKFVEEMAAIGITRLTANLFCGQSREERLLELAASEKIEAIKRMDLATEKYGIDFDGEWKSAVVQMITGAQFSCPAGIQQLVFSADGDIYPCQRFAGTKINFGKYTEHFWETLMDSRCRHYNHWHAQLYSGFRNAQAEETDLAGWGCPFLSFLRGEPLNTNYEKNFNRYLLDYYVTRPLDRIMVMAR